MGFENKSCVDFNDVLSQFNVKDIFQTPPPPPHTHYSHPQ